MFVEHIFFVGLRDIDFNNNLKIKSLLSFFEDIGGIHSNKVGYGLLDIPLKNKSWILLSWKVKILKRPLYSENLKIITWSQPMEKLYAYRDFEVFNENKEKVAIATSKWVCIDVKKGAISKIDEEIKQAYQPEEKQVFNEEIEKLIEPQNYSDSCNIKITRDMIDVNGHVHNLNYIDFATQILPYEIMQKAQNINVLYKKEIKENNTIKCFHSIENDNHYVTIKSEEGKNIHAIIKIN